MGNFKLLGNAFKADYGNPVFPTSFSRPQGDECAPLYDLAICAVMRPTGHEHEQAIQ